MVTTIWTYIGIALLAWVGWDLYAGYTLVWDWVYRAENPALYWSAVAIWTVLAVSCFVPWRKDAKD